jgi:ATP-dependent Clp protease ATP-binding subunit ClpA
VGKSSIIHGLAQRLAVGDVPGSLKESRLLGLELGLLMAGAAYSQVFLLWVAVCCRSR